MHSIIRSIKETTLTLLEVNSVIYEAKKKKYDIKEAIRKEKEKKEEAATHEAKIEWFKLAKEYINNIT